MDDPRAEVEIKPQLKPRGSMAKEEDPKPSHQLYKVQVKSTRSTGQTVSILKEVESSHKRKPLVLIAVETGGKNTQE